MFQKPTDFTDFRIRTTHQPSFRRLLLGMMKLFIAIAAMFALVSDTEAFVRTATGGGFHPDVEAWCDALLALPEDQGQPLCWCPGFYSQAMAGGVRVNFTGHPINKYGYACGKPMFNSQHGQDFWLARNLFQGMRGTNFTYVDLATNDPVWRSSTLFFDACLGWRLHRGQPIALLQHLHAAQLYPGPGRRKRSPWAAYISNQQPRKHRRLEQGGEQQAERKHRE